MGMIVNEVDYEVYLAKERGYIVFVVPGDPFDLCSVSAEHTDHRSFVYKVVLCRQSVLWYRAHRC